MKNNKSKGDKNDRLLSCYFITSRRLLLGKAGRALTDVRSVLKYMKEIESYQYRYNPATGGKTHFVSAADIARWNEQIEKLLKE